MQSLLNPLVLLTYEHKCADRSFAIVVKGFANQRPKVVVDCGPGSAACAKFRYFMSYGTKSKLSITVDMHLVSSA